jgi:tetratricopeptide (TPR) repeat protein
MFHRQCQGKTVAPDRPERPGARLHWRRPMLVLPALVVVGLLAALVVGVARRQRDDPAELGGRLVASGDYRGAIPYLLRAVAVRGDDPWAHYRLGLAYARIGWSGAAIDQFSTAAHLAPQSSEFRAGLGCAFRDAGEIAAALRELEQATRLAPDEPRHRIRLAELLLEVRHRTEAVKHLREAARLRPASPAIQGLLTQAAAGTGQRQKAARDAWEEWRSAADAALGELDRQESGARPGLGSEWDACAPAPPST